MITLLALVLRLALLAVFTFGFIVLFEHGPSGFVEGLKGEGQRLFVEVTKGSEKSETEVKSVPAEPVTEPTPAPAEEPPAPVDPAPPATPASTSGANAPAAWKELQSRPIGTGIADPVGVETN